MNRKIACLLAMTLCASLFACAKKPDNLEFVFPDQLPAKITNKWDGKARNVIYIKNKAWDKIFDLHLFEDITASSREYPKKQFFNHRRLNADLWRWEPADKTGWKFSLDQTEVLNYELHGTVKMQENKVLVDGQITNRGNLNWGGAIGFICFRLRNAPGFEDPDARRVYLEQTADHKLISVSTFCKPFNPRYGGPQYFEVPRNDPARPKYLTRIYKRDITEKQQVSIETEPCNSMMGNRAAALNCIHTNVDCSLKPGETRPFKIVIEFDDL